MSRDAKGRFAPRPPPRLGAIPQKGSAAAAAPAITCPKCGCDYTPPEGGKRATRKA